MRGSSGRHETRGAQRCVDRRFRHATLHGQDQYFSSASRRLDPVKQSPAAQPPNCCAHHSIGTHASCTSIEPMHLTAAVKAAPWIPDPVLTRWTPVIDVYSLVWHCSSAIDQGRQHFHRCEQTNSIYKWAP